MSKMDSKSFRMSVSDFGGEHELNDVSIQNLASIKERHDKETVFPPASLSLLRETRFVRLRKRGFKESRKKRHLKY